MCAGPEIAALVAAMSGTAAAGTAAAGTAAAGATAAGLTAAEIAALELAATGAGEAGLLGMTGASAAPGAGAYELATVGQSLGEGLLGVPPTSIPNAMGANAASVMNGQGLLTGGKGGGAGLMAQQMGMNMMQPQQPPPQRPGMPMQGQQGPLMSPNERTPYGTSAGNSLGGKMPMSEEEKRRLRAMGIQV